MPRRRYRQNSLPIGPTAPVPTLYGPAQPVPASMQLAEQGLLDVLPLGPLFDEGAVVLQVMQITVPKNLAQTP